MTECYPRPRSAVAGRGDYASTELDKLSGVQVRNKFFAWISDFQICGEQILICCG